MRRSVLAFALVCVLSLSVSAGDPLNPGAQPTPTPTPTPEIIVQSSATEPDSDPIAAALVSILDAIRYLF